MVHIVKYVLQDISYRMMESVFLYALEDFMLMLILVLAEIVQQIANHA
jgi:hypothetical protein